jgi:hypothetical protein
VWTAHPTPVGGQRQARGSRLLPVGLRQARTAHPTPVEWQRQVRTAHPTPVGGLRRRGVRPLPVGLRRRGVRPLPVGLRRRGVRPLPVGLRQARGSRPLPVGLRQAGGSTASVGLRRRGVRPLPVGLRRRGVRPLPVGLRQAGGLDRLLGDRGGWCWSGRLSIVYRGDNRRVLCDDLVDSQTDLFNLLTQKIDRITGRQIERCGEQTPLPFDLFLKRLPEQRAFDSASRALLRSRSTGCATLRYD